MFQIQNILEQVLKESTETKSSKNCICHEYGRIVSERRFKDRLYKERKRTERTKSPVTVVFVNVSRVNGSVKKRKNVRTSFINQLTEIVSKCTRETDYAGWYECNRIIGMIFLDTSTTVRDVIVERVKKRFEETKIGVINAEIDIAVITFPFSESLVSDSLAFTVYPTKKDTFSEKMFLSIKRMFDIVGGITGLLFFSPLFILVSLLIKVNSKGPIFFKQKRVGEGGVVFVLYKFRSMYTDTKDNIHRNYVTQLIKGKAEKQGGVYKIRDDPRVTGVGRILRKFSIDELPQFINVVKGEMSLVGPRPPIPYETSEYELWHLRRIMECKPGITGLWQVEGRSRTNFDEMVRLDLEYVQKRSLLLDIKLIIKTPWALLTARGAF